MHTTTYEIDKQGPTVQHRKLQYIQYLVITYNGKDLKKNIYMCICIYICITESLCYTSETNTTL